jgi:oligoendopeptidase F
MKRSGATWKSSVTMPHSRKPRTIPNNSTSLDGRNCETWALKSPKISETRSFAVPEIQNLTDDRFTELTQSPLLDPWKIYLERLRRYRPHTLSAGEERLLALAGAVVSGYKEIFSQLTHVDMKFGTLTTNHGEKIGLTLGLADSLLANPDRGTRRRAFHQLYRPIKNHQFTLASALAASVRADVFYARSRRYPSALAAALFPDNIPFAVYDNLIATVRRHLPIVHQYYTLRRQIFRNKLYYYDTFIPIAPETSDPRIQAFLIDRSLERLRSALVRQTMFAEFEKTIHETEEAGHGLTLEFFRRTYNALLKEYLGPAITIDPELELECLRIPHFYTAFYVYRYALALSAAMMLATRILTGDQDSAHRYHDLLRSGCTKFPIDALLDAGIDLQSSEPITNAMDIFAHRLVQLTQRLSAASAAL